MCLITRTAYAILILCYAIIPAQKAMAIEPQSTHRQRHLQDQTTGYTTYETTFTDTTNTNTNTDAPSPAPIIQVPQDAIIRGKVYSDLNLNGQQESTEPPVAGVVVKLFLCSTQLRVGITRTNDDGDYLFTIPGTALPPSTSTSKSCYYIQYTVNNYIVPNAIFTAPQNGETSDIYLTRGDVTTNVDAGIFGSTDSPTFEWATYAPTTTTRAPSPAPFITIPIPAMTERPFSLAPVTMAPTVGPSGAPAKVTAKPTESPVVSVGTLPLPTETVVIDDDATVVVSSVASVVPTQGPVASVSLDALLEPTSSPVQVVVNWEAGGNDAVGKDDAVIVDDNEQPENGRPQKQELPANETLIKPSKNEEAEPVEEEEEVSNESSDTVAKKGVLNFQSTVLIQLSNLPSEISQTELFEEVCGEFLNEELAIATPPIYDLECQIVSQTLEGGGGRRILRALAESNLKVEVEVTGEAKKTPSTQEPEDVPFDALLVGTFTVQGYLFAEALKNEEKTRMEEEGTSEGEEAYFGFIGNVRGINTNGAERQGEPSDVDGNGFTKGVIAAIVVGGVVMLLMLLLIGANVKQRSKSGSSASGANSSGSKRSANKSNLKAGTKSGIRSRVARSKKPPTSPSLTAAPSGSPKSLTTSYIAAAPSGDSEDVEIGLDPAIVTAAIPPTTKSTTTSKTQPTRIRRDIVAPSGKLGIMVANTKTGLGPAVHTIRPGSPMEGLIYVNDIIVAVNDVDTRKYNAGQITQVMKDTVGGERKISVLSTHR